MKISIVVGDLSAGGAVRGFLLAQILKKLQHEVEVIGFQFGKDLYAIAPAQIPVVSIPGRLYPQFFGAARDLLKRIDGDILYAVKPKPTSLGVALLKTLRSHRPVILDIDDWELSWHGGGDWRYHPSLKQLYRDLFKPNGALLEPEHPLYVKWTEKLVPYATAVTVDTQFLKDRFGGVYLPNGKDTDLFNPDLYNPQESRSRYGLSDYKILMFPGAPRPHKGIEDVLVALENLNDPRFRLVIVGGSPYDDYDDQLIDRWEQWIIKLPRQPVDQMPEVIAAADVVVVPQRDTLTARAQFPLKLTDGMAMAKPVLSTRVGDIEEILGDTGYLVDPNAPEQLAEAIAWIFQHPDEAAEKGMRARQRCLQRYGTEAMASILSQVLGTLIAP